jgi:NADPH-dependent curcumin reductase CurA
MSSDVEGFAAGEVVTGRMKWAEYQTHDGEGLTKVPPGTKLSYSLGVLGMPGMTAWAGLNIHGQPKAGETLVVSAASGAVGSLVAQLGKLKGLRVVGVAGGPEKCAFVRDELGADDCLDHRDPDLAAKMAAACPDGIDIYFENVGGVTLDAVLPNLNTFARIPLCGVISHYRLGANPPGPDRLPGLWRRLLTTRSTVRGFIIFDHWDRYPEFLEEVTPMVMDGRIKARESVSEGLASAPEAFISLLGGGNFGKQVVRVGPEP